jgi:hypothetical protein
MEASNTTEAPDRSRHNNAKITCFIGGRDTVILEGKVTTMPYGEQSVIAIGNNPVAEYLSQLNGKTVDLEISSEDSDEGIDDIGLPLTFTGVLRAQLIEETEDEIVIVPEEAFVDDHNLLETLYDLEGYTVKLFANAVNVSSGIQVSTGSEYSSTEDIGLLADLVHAILTGSVSLYSDYEYLVLKLQPGEIQYYRSNVATRRFTRLDVIPKDLADRLATRA